MHNTDHLFAVRVPNLEMVICATSTSLARSCLAASTITRLPYICFWLEWVTGFGAGAGFGASWGSGDGGGGGEEEEEGAG